MKSLRFLLVFSLLISYCTNGYSQQWFQPEDEWVFSYSTAQSGTYGYLDMKVGSDTIYGGKPCKHLILDGRTYSHQTRDTAFVEKSYFAYQDGDQIFIANQWSPEFKLSFDMGLEIGDTLGGESSLMHGPTIMVLDSISSTDINGVLHKTQHFKIDSTDAEYVGVDEVTVIEGIGTLSLFGFITFNPTPEVFMLHPTLEEFCYFQRGNFSIGQDSAECRVLPEPYHREFAPIGAKWYVELFGPEVSDLEGTVIYESLRDTVVNGKDCRVINKSHWSSSVPLVGEFIIHQEYGKVFHYIEEIDSFNLLFHFLVPDWRSFDLGNSYVEYGTRAEYLTEVDSSYFLFDLGLINPLRVDQVSTYDISSGEKEYIRSYELIENVGFRTAFLPDSGGNGMTDVVWEGKVRCYEDDRVSYNFTDGECLISSIEEPEVSQYAVYPNPTYQMLNINYPQENSSAKLQIMDLNGNILLSEPLKHSVNLENLTPGCYFLHIRSEYHESHTMKLIKY